MIPRHLFSVVLCLALATLAHAADPAPAHAPYPENFLNWKKIKATSLDPAAPATAELTDAHFVYANAAALEGLRTGTYPEGAVFVLDILKVERKGGTTTLGQRASTSTMVRDASAASTGGWRFEDYDIVTKAALEIDVVKDCYVCHTKVAKRQHVFTRLKP